MTHEIIYSQVKYKNPGLETNPSNNPSMRAYEDENSETKMIRVGEQGPKLTISTVTQQPKTEAD